MVDTGVNQSSWNTITRDVSTSTTGIGKLSDMRFSRTDLTPFTTFNDVLEHFNKSIVTLKLILKMKNVVFVLINRKKMSMKKKL